LQPTAFRVGAAQAPQRQRIAELRKLAEKFRRIAEEYSSVDRTSPSGCTKSSARSRKKLPPWKAAVRGVDGREAPHPSGGIASRRSIVLAELGRRVRSELVDATPQDLRSRDRADQALGPVLLTWMLARDRTGSPDR
jgi:hypothetical protein